MTDLDRYIKNAPPAAQGASDIVIALNWMHQACQRLLELSYVNAWNAVAESFNRPAEREHGLER